MESVVGPLDVSDDETTGHENPPTMLEAVGSLDVSSGEEDLDSSPPPRSMLAAVGSLDVSNDEEAALPPTRGAAQEASAPGEREPSLIPKRLPRFRVLFATPIELIGGDDVTAT